MYIIQPVRIFMRLIFLLVAIHLISNKNACAFLSAPSDTVSQDFSVYSPTDFEGSADEVMALRYQLQEAQKAKNLEKQLDYTIRIGRYYQNLGINDEALSYYLQAIGLSNANPDADRLVYLQNSIAKVYLDNGMHQKAKEFNNRAINQLDADIDPSNAGMTYELQGKIFFTEGKWYKALEAAEQSIGYYRKAGDSGGMIRQWLLKAEVYQENKLSSKALSNLHEAEAVLDEDTPNRLKAEVFHQLAKVHKTEKRYQKAIQYLTKGFDVAEKSNDLLLQENLIRLKASVLAASGKASEALKAHNELLDVLDKADKSEGRRELMRLEVKYRTEQQKKKNEQLRKELARQKELRDLIILAGVVVVVIFFAVSLMRRYRRQRELNNTLESFNRELERRVKEQTHELELEIEERIKKTGEAEKAKFRAQESDRLKSEFLRNISHEIRTPMNRITGYSDLLAESATDPEEKEYATIVREDSERLMKLLSDILELSRLATEDVQPSLSDVDLEELFTGLKSKFAYKARTRLTFNVIVPPSFEGKKVLTDPEKLEDLLSHLLDNAFKFTDQGEVTLAVSAKSAGYSIYVKDTGIGIRKEQLSHIFDFFRKLDVSGKRLYEGVGAGLTLAKYLTDMLGGHLQVVSEHGEGTTVEIYFPYRKKDESFESQEFSGAGGSKSSWMNRKLLIIDEHKSNVDFIKAILKKTRIQIIWEEDTADALRYLGKSNEPDAVLINNTSDRSETLDKISQIKAMNYTIPIIMISSASARNFTPANVDEVLTRPISHKILLEKLSYIFSD